MSERLQVMIPDTEMPDIQLLARGEYLIVGSGCGGRFGTRTSRPAMDPETKLKAVRRGSQYSFPTDGPEQMPGDIGRGYRRAPSSETQPTTDALHATGAEEFLALSSRVSRPVG